MLSVRSLRVDYGHVQALRGVDLEAREGEITAIIGSNGAGKTSTLMAISGLAPVTEGRSSSAARPSRGGRPTRSPPSASPRSSRAASSSRIRASRTICSSAPTRACATALACDRSMEREMDRFPILRRRRGQLAGTLSGGEQQMLAIARGLMSEPTVLLMDEPSMGLAPLMVQEIARTIRSLREEGATIVLVEQMASVALQLADRAYVLETGRVTPVGQRPRARRQSGGEASLSRRVRPRPRLISCVVCSVA